MEGSSINLTNSLLHEEDNFEEEKLIPTAEVQYPDIKEEPLEANDMIGNYSQNTNQYQPPKPNQIKPIDLSVK